MLRQGEVNLLSLSLIAGILTDETKYAILSSIRGKSKREVERIVSRHRPVTSIQDRIRPVCIRVSNSPLCPPTEATPTGGSGPRRSGSALLPDGKKGLEAVRQGPMPPSPLDTVLEKHVIQFAVGSAFVEKLEQMRALLSHTMPRATLEQIFDVAMEAYLDKHSPERRAKRRRARARKAAEKGLGKPESTGSSRSKLLAGVHRGEVPEPARATASVPESTHGPANVPDSTRPTANVPEPARAATKKTPRAPKPETPQPEARTTGKERSSRHIPLAVRDRVFSRDGGRCTYVSAGGKRCNSKRNLQIDHVEPRSRGGSNDPSNLRLLCAHHNRLEAERILGFDPEARHEGKAGQSPARHI
jgi:hypothetical protein